MYCPMLSVYNGIINVWSNAVFVQEHHHCIVQCCLCTKQSSMCCPMLSYYKEIINVLSNAVFAQGRRHSNV